ncbi:MAG: hypothetical protein ACJA0U_002532 [Salibacteraceae bacterium]|jgi:hypothetical protein
MKNYTEIEIESLMRRFETRKLLKEEWTHEAHLVVVIDYCSTYTLSEALGLSLENISKHNESTGGINTDTDGYHETITKFWLIIADKFLENNSFESSLEACNAFINSKFGGSKFPFTYYSENVLFSAQARHNWIEPDLKPIDSI